MYLIQKYNLLKGLKKRKYILKQIFEQDKKNDNSKIFGFYMAKQLNRILKLSSKTSPNAKINIIQTKKENFLRINSQKGIQKEIINKKKTLGLLIYVKLKLKLKKNKKQRTLQTKYQKKMQRLQLYMIIYHHQILIINLIFKRIDQSFSIYILNHQNNNQLYRSSTKRQQMPKALQHQSQPQKNKGKGYDYLFKAIIVGNSAVGKTNIVLRFTQGQYDSKHMSTIGVDFKIKTLQVEDKRVRMQIWDTAGQCRFRNIVKTYFQGASGILFVYSVSDRESFDCIEQWIKQSEQSENPQGQSRILLANKIDVLRQDHQVTRQEGQNLAKRHKMNFFEVSAKENKNIYQAFEDLAAQMKENCDKKHTRNIINPHQDSIVFDGQTGKKNNKKCC